MPIVDVRTREPFHVEAEPPLQRDPVMGLLHLGVGEARHQVALRLEAAIQREAIAAGGVELLGGQAQPDRGFGPALRPHHAGGAAAGAVAEGARLEQDHVFHAAFGEQDGRPRTDRSTADHHDVGAAGAGHTTKRWHRLNAQSRPRAGYADVRTDGGGSAHPGHGTRLRRVADAPRGRGRTGGRNAAQGTDGRAPGEGNRTGPVRHQHAGVGGRSGMHGAAAGAGAGTDRPGHQRAGLGDGHATAVVGRRGHRVTSASAGCCRRCAARSTRRTRSPRSSPGPTCPALQTTARRDGDEYVDRRNQVARHVVQPRRLRLRRGRAAGRRACGRSRAAGGRPAVAGRGSGSHAALFAPHRRRAPDRRVQRRPRPGLPSRRRRGRTDDVHPGLVPVRAADGGRRAVWVPRSASSTR